MIEQVKTIILTILIGSSVVLTWQLWTYQPEFELLEAEGDYVESQQLAEPVRLGEVVLPSKIVFHQEHEHTVTFGNEQAFFQTVMEELQNAEMEHINLIEEPLQNQVYTGEDVIEFVFPSPVANEVFTTMIGGSDDFADSYSGGFERLLLIDNGSDQLQIRFLSFDEQVVLEGTIDIHPEHFQEEYMVYAEGNYVYPAFEYRLGSSGDSFRKPLYLPEENLLYERLQYQASSISENRMIPFLFNDPSLVQNHTDTQSGEERYISGNRMVTVSANGDSLDYVNQTTYTDSSQTSDTDLIMTAYNYINAHGGYTDDYQLYEWEETVQGDEVFFRMTVGGLPVLGTNRMNWEMSAQSHIRIEREGDQISRYTRPMFELIHQPFDELTQQIELPTGTDVLEHIDEESNFEFDLIEDIQVGYEMHKQNSGVTFTPGWYILYNNSWYGLDFEASGGDEDGLE